MTTDFDIAVLAGDGIGMEVMSAALVVLEAAVARAGGFSLNFSQYAGGAQCYLDTGTALPDHTMKSAENAHAILFGAMGLPHVRTPEGTEVIPQVDLRLHLDLYAGVRPIRSFAGLPMTLSDPRAAHIDFVLIREQTEGLFYAWGRGEVIEDSKALDTMLISRAGTTRVSDFAFRLAQRRKARGKPGRVTCVDKANVFTSMAFMRKVFLERAKLFPDIEADYAYVDAIALNLIRQPWNYDVMVTENMFGDILSDLAAGLIGGMGLAPSADIGDRHGLFQPAHGSAPDIVGQGKANPTAMILSAAMMLEWLGHRHSLPACELAAQMIEQAVEMVFAQRTVMPCEFGGKSSTADITCAVIDAIRHVDVVSA